MNYFLVAISVLSLVAATAAVLYEHYRVKRTIDTIEEMLHRGLNGNFRESVFDESRMSRLETEFAHYLSASVLSAKNLENEKNKIKSLISDISHQTKTPIANLLLYSELLSEEDLPEKAVNNVKAVHAQAEKLQFLISSLVKLSRLENGVVSLSPIYSAVMPILKDVQKQFDAKAKSKGLQIIVQNTDSFAFFDTKWTTEAIANIVDNAIKYTDFGVIKISAVEYELFTRIDISDTGVGIPKTEYEKIFARFYRSESAACVEGVGIGLYLTREIISGEGGYVKVNSEPENGTTFSVFLPKKG